MGKLTPCPQVGEKDYFPPIAKGSNVTLCHVKQRIFCFTSLRRFNVSSRQFKVPEHLTLEVLSRIQSQEGIAGQNLKAP